MATFVFSCNWICVEKRNIVWFLFDVDTLVEENEKEEPSLNKEEQLGQGSQKGTLAISAVCQN